MYATPNVPADVKQLPEFLSQELKNLAAALDGYQDSILLKTLYAPPSRIRPGMMVLADGTSWNPGSGAGVYAYYGGAWHFLG